MAIVETLKEFKGMLWGQRIKVYTDHKNLIQVSADSDLSRLEIKKVTGEIGNYRR